MRNFQQFYEACLRYKRENGHLFVPALYSVDGYRLGDKIHAVRRGLARLNDDERQMLNDIGFIWKVRYDYSFSEIYRLLVLYKAKNGNCDVPLGYVSKSGIPLGRVLRNLKNGWKKVSFEEAYLLREIGITIDEETYQPKKHLDKPVKSRKVVGLDIKPNYIVIKECATSREEAIQKLQQSVSDKTKEGYIPSGGIFIEKSHPSYIVYQSMILLD